MKKLLTLLGFGLTSLSFHAYAHPHAWIDVQSHIVLSEDGQVQAIEQAWLFDDLYSATILDGIAEDYTDTEQALQQYATDVINNLEPYGYFIRLMVNDQRVTLGTITQYSINKHGSQLLLSFSAPLEKPADLRQNTVAFSVYDPTYYIHMTHPAESPPTISPHNGLACRTQVTQPTPSAEDFSRAFTLDKSDTVDDDLGHLFAEKVHIQCQN